MVASVGAEHTGYAGGILLPGTVPDGGNRAAVPQPVPGFGDSYKNNFVFFV